MERSISKDPGGCPAVVHRPLGLLLSLVSIVGAAWAVGPTLPLRFDVDPIAKEAWALRLIAEPEVVSGITIERRLFQTGELIERYPLEVKLEPARELSRRPHRRAAAGGGLVAPPPGTELRRQQHLRLAQSLPRWFG